MRKLLQLKLYSFLSSKWGMTFCVVGLFVTLNTFFQIVQLLLDTHTVVQNPEWSENISGRSYKHIMCSEPIDVVYTWVNGSDPLHIKAVNDLKRSLRDPNMPHCNATQTPDKDDCYVDEDTQSRFIDNEELRYSLRSLEAFAPWVRNVYLVTNGQIPSWINMDNPRLRIVTHEEIFHNKSHLPTFSSPSIETHLHRIPGLSSKFLYLNDDVMFGREIYPDDFYTHHAGQKVFLSWPVPNCAEGCPSNWIGDGYCDLACNVSACDFDAHDCDNYTGSATNTGGSRWWNPGSSTTSTSDISSRYKNYCAKGCPDTWIGDKYCDRMCKNVECGFDAGDCGVEDIYSSMHGVEVTWNISHVDLPHGLPSVYFNLSAIVQSATITDGSHDNAGLVRTATISQKHKIMTLTFHRNVSLQEVMLSITAEHSEEGGNKTIIEKTFNITIDTTILPSNETSNETLLLNDNTVNGTLPLNEQTSTMPPLQNLSQLQGRQTVDTANAQQGGTQHNNDQHSSDTKNPDTQPDKAQDNAQHGKEQGNSPQDDMQQDKAPLGNTRHNNTKQGESLAVAAPAKLRENTANSVMDADEGKTDAQPQIDTIKEQVAKTEDGNSINNNSSDTSVPGALLTEQRPVNDGSKVSKDGGGEEPHIKEAADTPKEISSDPLPPVSNTLENSGAGVRKLLSIAIDGAASHRDAQWQQQQAVAARKIEQLQHMEAERAADLERERLLRINKEYEKLLVNETNGDSKPLWPWERQKQLDDVREMRGGGRRLLDMYGDSLKHVNKLFNHAFGPSARKVPAHMPHMIDKSIMEELQARWPEEWEKTSTHSLRHAQDMQYAFAYFYYLIHAKVEYNLTDIWINDLDIDGDGVLNDNELRTLGVHLYGAPLKETSLAELKELLVNVCVAHRQNKPGYSSSVPQHTIEEDDTDDLPSSACPITLEVVEACNKTSEELRKIFSKRLKYKHQLDGTDEVAFIMVSNNHTVMEGKFDGIRQKRHKFVCLNDNINHSSPDAGNVVAVLHDFYLSVLPKPSSFELPGNVRNAHAYVNELHAARAAATQHRRFSIAVGVLAIVALLFALCKCYTYVSRADRRVRERRANRFLNT